MEVITKLHRRKKRYRAKCFASRFPEKQRKQRLH